MKNYLIIGGIIIVSLVGIWLLAAKSDEQAAINEEDTASLPQEPEDHDPSAEPSPTAEYISEYNPDLKLSYPTDWNITAGTDNSAEQQLVTFESPKDANGYYFCLNLTELGLGSETELETAGAIVVSNTSFTADGIGKDLSSIIFTVRNANLDNLLWSVIDGDSPIDTGDMVGDSSFQNHITNPQGRRLQTLGRFNCREAEDHVTDIDQFQNSRWFNDARLILRSLSY